MFSPTDEISIAVAQLVALQKLLEEIGNDDAARSVGFLKIEEFCLGHLEKWKRLNINDDDSTTNDGLDIYLFRCAEQILALSDRNEDFDDVTVLKIISVLATFFDCISKICPSEEFDRLSDICSKMVERVLNKICSSDLLNPVDETANSKMRHSFGSLEARYCIVETILKNFGPFLSLDWKDDSTRSLAPAILQILKQGISAGNIKITAKICSELLKDIFSRLFDQDRFAALMREMLFLLNEISTDSDECSAMEARSVGTYCMVKTMLDLYSSGALESNVPSSPDVALSECDHFYSLLGQLISVPKCETILLECVRKYLISDVVLVRKCGRSLLSLLMKNPGGRCDSYGAFEDYLTLMQTFELKQLHVVKPAFGLLDRLIKHCQDTGQCKGKCFDLSWLRLAFYNAMHHTSAYVITWAISKYFAVDPRLVPGIVGEENCQFLFDTVLTALNSSDAYCRISEDGGLCQFLKNMESFLDVAAGLSAEVFWRKWLDTMKNNRMAPVPLFHLSHILSRVSDDHNKPAIITYSDIPSLREIFWGFGRIPQLFIRAAVQEANLKILFNLSDWNEAFLLKSCAAVLSLVPTLIRPEKTARFRQTVETYSWIFEDTFPDKMLAISSSVTSLQTDESGDVQWSMDSVRALVAMLHGLNGSEGILVPILQVVDSALKTDGAWNEYKSNRVHTCISLVTAWMEIGPNDLLRLAEKHLPKLVSTMTRMVIDCICSCQNLTTGIFVTYRTYLLAVLTSAKMKKVLSQEDVIGYIQRVDGVLIGQQSNCTRIFFLFQTYTMLLEHLSERSVQREDTDLLLMYANQYLCNVDIFDKVEHSLKQSRLNRAVSEHAAARWRCMLCMCKAFSAAHNAWYSPEWILEMNELALDALDVINGAGEAHVVMKCFYYMMPEIVPNEPALVASILRKMLLVCYEQRKCDQFVPTVRQCCASAFQPRLLFCNCDDVLIELKNISDTFISETENFSLACCVAEAFNGASEKIVQGGCFTTSTLSEGERYFWKTLVELCCFGFILRKDQRIQYDASEMIKTSGSDVYKCVESMESDHTACQKTRFYAFHSILLVLDKLETARDRIVSYLVELACEKLEESISGATKTGYFANSQCHRVRTRAVQVLLLIEPFVQQAALALRLQEFTLRYLTENNQQPSVRLSLEWLMTRLNLRFATDGLLDKWWDAETYMVSKRMGTLCTWMEVLMHTGLCLAPERRRAHVLECAKRWLPWCTAQNFTLRCCAQTCLRRLWTDQQACMNSDHEWILLDQFLTPTINFDKEQKNNTKNIEKASRDFYFSIFNAVRDCTLETIFSTFPRLCFMPFDELVPVDWWRGLGKDGRLCGVLIENESRDLEQGSVFVWRDRTAATVVEEMNQAAPYDSLQTKTNLLGGAADGLKALGLAGDQIERQEGLVVVATLVDRPTNLGGLCRTCEIFGVSEYAISTLKVTEELEFQALSVTSEKWVKMIEVKRMGLASYLRNKQSNGYTLVAVEQTTTSRRLTDYQFPSKTLLLLGNEKEGIPVDLLQFVDVRVEIPQIGHTRSLNVHVAGALLIWEYSKQQRFGH